MGNIRYFIPILILSVMLFAREKQYSDNNETILGINGTSRLVEIEQNNSSIMPESCYINHAYINRSSASMHQL